MAGIDLGAFDAFKVMIRDQIANSMLSIAYYSAIVKAQINSGMLWAMTQVALWMQAMRGYIASAIANMGNGFAYVYAQLSYFFANFKAIAANALMKGLNWLVKGFQYGYRFCKFLLNKIGDLIVAIPNILKSAWRWIVKGFHFGYRFCKFLLNQLGEFLKIIPTILKGMWRIMRVIMQKIIDNVLHFLSNIHLIFNKIVQFAKDLVVGLKDAVVFIAKQLHHFVTHLSHYLNTILNFGMQLLKNIGIAFQTLFKNFGLIFKELWSVISSVARFMANHAWSAITWLAAGVSKRLFMGIGMIYGISAVLVEALGSGLNALALKVVGVNLAGVAAFTTLQTGLSLALAAFIGYQILRFSLYALGGIFAISFFQKQPANAQVMPAQPDDGARARPEIGQQREYAPGFRQRRNLANDGEIREAPSLNQSLRLRGTSIA